MLRLEHRQKPHSLKRKKFFLSRQSLSSIRTTSELIRRYHTFDREKEPNTRPSNVTNANRQRTYNALLNVNINFVEWLFNSICSVARQSESTKKAKVGRGINIPAWFGELPKIERHDESPNFSEGTVLDETRVMVNPRSCRDDSTCSPEASLVANEALLPWRHLDAA